MRGVVFIIVILAAAPAVAQVQVDVHLEKPHYLEGEPIIAIVDVTNVGDEAVAYSTCSGDVQLTIPGVPRRVPPNVFGCFAGFGSGAGCGTGDPPLLTPGQRTSFKSLMREYQLKAGAYRVVVSGRAGISWKSVPFYQPTVPPAPPGHKQGDPVPGARFERTVDFVVVRGGEAQLARAFEPVRG